MMAVSTANSPETTSSQAVVRPKAGKGYTTGFVTSKDGTKIGYRRYGQESGGSGVVLLHGSMSSGHNHEQLALALADAFTVYLPDRRGRDLSGPYPKDFSIQTEVDDLHALLTETG